MLFQISEKAVEALHERLGDAVADRRKQIPGAVVCVVNKNGERLFSEADGQIGADTVDPMKTDTILWLASCTKLFASVAAMQLVERGVLDLDSSDQVEELLPFLKNVQVLEEKSGGTLHLVEKKGSITLRQLLSHTSGFGYGGYVPKLRDWIMAGSKDLIDFEQPLVAQPGEDWNYGFSIEWVSIMIEKSSGKRMSSYMQDHIFHPLGLKDTSLFPDTTMKARMAKVSHRNLKDGTLMEGAHFMQRSLDMETDEEKEKAFQNAARGLFSTAPDYCELIATLLNHGTSPTTGAQILKPSTVDKMFENQIPQFPDFARKGMADAIPEANYYIHELYPAQPHHQPQGWGLSFMLTLEPTAQGRGPNTGCWAGMANCYWWADRSKGVGGFIGTQVLPFSDPIIQSLCYDVETIVYSGQTPLKH